MCQAAGQSLVLESAEHFDSALHKHRRCARFYRLLRRFPGELKIPGEPVNFYQYLLDALRNAGLINATIDHNTIWWSPAVWLRRVEDGT